MFSTSFFRKKEDGLFRGSPAVEFRALGRLDRWIPLTWTFSGWGMVTLIAPSPRDRELDATIWTGLDVSLSFPRPLFIYGDIGIDILSWKTNSFWDGWPELLMIFLDFPIQLRLFTTNKSSTKWLKVFVQNVPAVTRSVSFSPGAWKILKVSRHASTLQHVDIKELTVALRPPVEI